MFCKLLKLLSLGFLACQMDNNDRIASDVVVRIERTHEAPGKTLTLVHRSMYRDVEISDNEQCPNNDEQPSIGGVQADSDSLIHSTFIERLLCAKAFICWGWEEVQQ